MFSLNIRNSQRVARGDAGLGQALLGRLLGFLAGLALAFAFDAIVLDHAIQASLSRNDWGMARMGYRLAALVAR